MIDMDAKFVDVLYQMTQLTAGCADSYDLRPYSGRGMYGSECVAVSTNRSLGNFFGDFLVSCQSVFDDDSMEFTEVAEYFSDIFNNLCMDNMGKGIVFYFPELDAELLESYNKTCISF